MKQGTIIARKPIDWKLVKKKDYVVGESTKGVSDETHT